VTRPVRVVAERRRRPAKPPLEEPEAHFQREVVKLARAFGWRVYHPWLSVHSASGWPDLAMVRDGRFLVAELKTETGRASRAQQLWLEDLAAAGVETHLWRPHDWPEIARVLTGAQVGASRG